VQPSFEGGEERASPSEGKKEGGKERGREGEPNIIILLPRGGEELRYFTRGKKKGGRRKKEFVPITSSIFL